MVHCMKQIDGSGIIVRDAETGRILAVHPVDDEGFADAARRVDRAEGWAARHRETLDLIRPFTELAALAGTPVMRVAVAGAWLVVDAALLRDEVREDRVSRLRGRMAAGALGLAGLALAAGTRLAPAALRARAGLIGGAQRAIVLAERIARRIEDGRAGRREP